MRVSKQAIQKEPGYLYFLGKDGYVWAAPMKHNKTGKRHKVGTEFVKRPKGMTYISKEGYVETSE